MLRNIVKLKVRQPFQSVRPKRWQTAQAQAVANNVAAVDPEWETAMPFDKISGPSIWRMMKNFAPGGRYHNCTLPQMHKFLQEDYGNLMRLPGMFGREPILLSFNPNDFEKLFRAEGKWPVRRGLESFVYYRKKVRPDVFKGMGGLLTEDGEPWQSFRTTVNPVMMQPKTIKLYVSKVDEVAREFMEIMTNLRDEKNELPADYDQWLNRWALETMGVLALDTRLGVLKEESDEAKHIVTNIRKFFELTYEIEVLPSLWRYFKTPKFRQLMSTLDDLTRLVMAKVDDAVVRLDNNPSTDSNTQSVLEKLLKVDRNVAIIMAFDMLLAGVDTTSSGTIGVLYCLAKNPEKQEKLRDELRAILPRKDSPLTPENMRNMPYLRACIKEGIRVCPPTAGNARATGRDMVLQGYRIPKGTDVVMSSMLLQNDDLHFARAKEFLPERWLKEDGIPEGKNSHPFVYLPFGFGARACIGKRLAMLEMEMIISRITRQFDYRWNYGELKIRGALVNIPMNELKFQMNEVLD
ncbi:probable cytochrome P450 12a4, mitochondrial [Malaya genurostris]|uniref:probable cytochrome P450 12a4, mitochondrial n=1 Tax=Malaya genurostris TaxID=325434 RepID=UPI0026F3C955|nr:probable cytochrome P450 12a4, mitochondrial [Malaya genurostris]